MNFHNTVVGNIFRYHNYHIYVFVNCVSKLVSANNIISLSVFFFDVNQYASWNLRDP